MFMNALVRVGSFTEKAAPYLGWSALILGALFAASRVAAQ
jgi:hypothetical protein